MSIIGSFIMPHPPVGLHEIGKGRELGIAETLRGCREVSALIAALRPDTIIVLSPHSIIYSDYFHISPGFIAAGDMGQFGAREVTVSKNYDRELGELLCEKCAAAFVPAGMSGQRDNKKLDHGTLIPLRFVDEQYSDYMLVRIGLSGLDAETHFRLGKCIADAAYCQRRRVAVIASGDLSHKLKPDGPYGYAEEGPFFDRQITDIIESGYVTDFLNIDRGFASEAAECGLRSFQIMAGVLDGIEFDRRLHSYEGPFGVGYATASFIPCGALSDRAVFRAMCEAEDVNQAALSAAAAASAELPEPEQAIPESEPEIPERGDIPALREPQKAREDIYVALARYSLEHFVLTGAAAELPDGLPDELLHTRAGAFVSLKEDGQLRGCIGTIVATQPSVAAEILRNAISAGTGDPRFNPVTAEELSRLEYSVDVLTPPERVRSAADLDPSRYGVIVSCGNRRGLLLPALDGINDVQTQIMIALRKGGIRPDEPYLLDRFEVVRHR